MSADSVVRQRRVTVRAPANIALVKYWGKRDVERMLPCNDSVSATLDALAVLTTVTLVHRAAADTVLVNGETMALAGSRFERVLAHARRLLRRRRADTERTAAHDRVDPIATSFHIDSSSDFPASAGLASSAAGFAAIAVALGRLLHLPPASVDLLARTGSGSACRSAAGSFAHWHAGADVTGADCKCDVIAPCDHWPELIALIAVCSSATKAVSSSAGMQRSVETSDYFKHRLQLLPARVAAVKEAIANRDFATLAQCVIKDSNAMHAICADSSPPIFYLNATSQRIIALVESFNASGAEPVAYTFDAGPNAVLLMQRRTLARFMAAFMHLFPRTPLEGDELQPWTQHVDDAECGEAGPSPAITYLRFSTVGSKCTVVDNETL